VEVDRAVAATLVEARVEEKSALALVRTEHRP
jgi:hypothetical protein